MQQNINEKFKNGMNSMNIELKTAEFQDHLKEDIVNAYNNLLDKRDEVNTNFQELIDKRDNITKNLLSSFVFLYYFGLAKNKLDKYKNLYSVTDTTEMYSILDNLLDIENAKSGLNLTQEKSHEMNRFIKLKTATEESVFNISSDSSTKNNVSYHTDYAEADDTEDVTFINGNSIGIFNFSNKNQIFTSKLIFQKDVEGNNNPYADNIDILMYNVNYDNEINLSNCFIFIPQESIYNKKVNSESKIQQSDKSFEFSIIDIEGVKYLKLITTKTIEENEEEAESEVTVFYSEKPLTTNIESNFNINISFRRGAINKTIDVTGNITSDRLYYFKGSLEKTSSGLNTYDGFISFSSTDSSFVPITNSVPATIELDIDNINKFKIKLNETPTVKTLFLDGSLQSLFLSFYNEVESTINLIGEEDGPEYKLLINMQKFYKKLNEITVNDINEFNAVYTECIQGIIDNFYLELSSIDDILSTVESIISSIVVFFTDSEENYISSVNEFILNYRSDLEADALKNLDDFRMIENKFEYFYELISEVNTLMFSLFKEGFESLDLLSQRIEEGLLFMDINLDSENKIKDLVEAICEFRNTTSLSEVKSFNGFAFNTLTLIDSSFETFISKAKNVFVVDAVTFAWIFFLSNFIYSKDDINKDEELLNLFIKRYTSMISDLALRKNIFRTDQYSAEFLNTIDLYSKVKEKYESIQQNINILPSPIFQDDIIENYFRNFNDYNLEKIISNSKNIEDFKNNLKPLKTIIYHMFLNLNRDEIKNALITINNTSSIIDSIKKDVFVYLTYLVVDEFLSTLSDTEKSLILNNYSISDQRLQGYKELEENLTEYLKLYNAIYVDLNISDMFSEESFAIKEILEKSVSIK